MSIQKFNFQGWGSSIKDLVINLPFPLTYLLLGIASATMAIEQPASSHNLLWLLCLPCMLISLSLSLTASANTWGVAKKILIQLIPVAILLAYFAILPKTLNKFEVYDITTYALLLLTACMMLTFLPLLGNKDANRLWVYNHKLFSRIILSGLFSGVLYAGTALALIAIDQMFGIKVSDKIFLHLLVLVVGLFGGTFFLIAFVKETWKKVEEISFPKVLKIFSLYILFPLVVVYMFILYIYFLRICYTWELPRGWASTLVLILAAVGILAYAASWPLAQKKQNMLASIYHRIFFFLFAPLLILLFVASLRRIADYGITEMRYFLVVIATWLTFVVMYFIFSRKKDLRFIPLTLAVIAVIASFGPLSAFSVSQRSQMSRLEKIMYANGMLKQGKLIPSTLLNDSISVEINILLDYFEDSKAGLQQLEKRWNTTFEHDSTDVKLRRQTVAEALHLTTFSTYHSSSKSGESEAKRVYWCVEREGRPIDIAEYRQLFTQCSLNGYNRTVDSILVNGKTLLISLSEGGDSVLVKLNGRASTHLNVNDYVKDKERQGWSIDQRGGAHGESLDFVLKVGEHKLKFVVTSFSAERRDSVYQANNISYHLLVR